MTLIYLAATWLAGIAIANSVSAAWWIWLILVVPAGLGLGLARTTRWRTGFGCILALALGAARYSSAVPQFGEDKLASYNGIGFVTVTGFVTEAPDVRDSYILLTVQTDSISLPQNEQKAVSGLVLVQAPRTKTYRYGDPVKVTGDLITPPSDEDFSYREFLARDGIYSMMQYAQVDVTGERQGSGIRAALLDFRSYAHSTILKLLPDPESSLLAGILLGVESGIAPDIREDFNATGAAHIIAISGANMVILAGLLQSTSQRFLPKTGSTIITIAGVVGYAIFVGGDPAVIRAAIMSTLALIATRLGRQTYGLASLSAAAMIITAINPLALWDVGFQLSFMATLGLVLYADPLQRLFGRLLERVVSAETVKELLGALSASVLVTIAAQITTAPIMAYYFERFSAVSLPINLLIVPVQSYIMVLGGLGVLFAMVIWPLGQLLAWGSWLLLAYTVWVVRLGASLPGASVPIGPLSPLTVAAIYVLILGITWLRSQPPDERSKWQSAFAGAMSAKFALFGGGMVAAFLFTTAASMPDGRLHVTFLDLGDGTATLIETPSGRHILVDAGGSGRGLSTAMGRELPFWDRSIDLLIVTQPTRSHLSGLLQVLDRYNFEAILTNGAPGDSDVAGAVWSKLAARGTPLLTAQPGMRVVIEDGLTLTVLTDSSGAADDPSDPGTPVVALLVYKDARILLTGDLSAENETQLLASYEPIHATLLVAARGGHRDVSSEAFLEAVDPQVIVLAVGANHQGGLPHPEALERLQATGATVYRTDQQGSIRISTDGQQLWVETDW